VKTGRIGALDPPGQIREALALGIISETEAAALHDYDAKVMDIINVDDFAPHELAAQAVQTAAAVAEFEVA
jgi:acyl-CoA dehydrogenase